MWTSDDPEALADAAEACGTCPVLDVCRDAGRGERWGAWGGVVRGTPRARRLPVQQAALLALATAPRPLTLDEATAEVAALLGDDVARRDRIADALARCMSRGQAARHPTTPRTFTATPHGEAAAAEWLNADGVGGVRASSRDTPMTPRRRVTDTSRTNTP
ncbi:hypothetical protein H5392_00580 [Tessaracoccus sp. MC1865]|uniref:hypothetical protein n=1 Tax=Tessaracoccus sp. MC1865 TaxID=2760310 RepID=UPI001603CC0B|nr:hypothetical protein [Tessaracoccus sp. MC1865]MBB1482354.1 hypothetical protein [Tessaracoccus sp. MC1865]QTO38178.1 hypothetical protein J7D54_03500 [Tessaracoccus sp. MC1865]